MNVVKKRDFLGYDSDTSFQFAPKLVKTSFDGKNL